MILGFGLLNPGNEVHVLFRHSNSVEKSSTYLFYLLSNIPELVTQSSAHIPAMPSISTTYPSLWRLARLSIPGSSATESTMAAPRNEPPNLLKNTSQGKKTDLPPQHWIANELKQFGATQTGRKWNLNLQGKVHTIFDRKRWKIEEARYDALEQSFILGTKLLEVAGPYLCNFLPDQHFTFEEQYGAQVRRLLVNDNRTEAAIDAANAVFVDIADSLQWGENRQMLLNTSRWGLNHASYEDEDKAILPEVDTGEDPAGDWEEASERAQDAGQQHRQITITIASQYVDAILASKNDSDQHLTAVFLAAVNMVHELGHTIYYHDLRSDCEGFWVGDDVHDETGHSFTAWLFDGWYPEPIDLGNDRDHYAMRTGVHWRKWYRRPVVKPRAIYSYSVPLTYIQRLFDQSEWSKFDTSKDSLRIRQELLRPRVPFRNGEHARTARMLTQASWTNGYHGHQERNEDEDEDEGLFASSSASKLAIDEDWTDVSVKGRLSTDYHFDAKLTTFPSGRARRCSESWERHRDNCYLIIIIIRRGTQRHSTAEKSSQ